jgi:sestrin
MPTDESQTDLESIFDMFGILKHVGLAAELVDESKLCKDVVSKVRSFVKESKPRTQEFRTYLKIIARLSYLSRYEEVRAEASSLIKELRHIFHIHEAVTPSRFEGDGFLGSPDFGRIPGMEPRISHLEWVLSSQGDFLDFHLESTEAILKADGPLPRAHRHFVAMLGAAAYGCEYLVRHEMEEFLKSDGDPNWLRDPETSVPKKLQSLTALNMIMAHRPWALDASLIESVLVSGRMSAAELVHSFIVLATYHSLPSLVYGAGIRTEDDLTTPSETCGCTTGVGDPFIESEPQWEETAALPRCFSLNDSATSLLQRLLQEAAKTKQADRPLSISDDQPGSIAAFEGFGALNETTGSGVSSPVSPQPTAARARTAPARMGEEEKNELAGIMTSQPKWKTVLVDRLRRLMEPSEYRDFSQKTDPILHTMSFSWEDHGMVVLSRHMMEAADRIHEEHVNSLDFTTNSIGDRPIDSTATVREAIVKYVQRMYGVFHDDYKYDQLNKILPVIHKAYLKKLACYPDRLTKVDYLRMRKFEGFSSLDLIHYAHLVAQTKRVVELTWAMKAFMNYQAATHHKD